MWKKYTKDLRIKFHSRMSYYRIEWYYGNICNQRCSYCLNNHTYSDYYKNVTKEQVDKVVNFINNFPKPLFDIQFIGGEPSCFKHFFYALERINRRGRINVMSNGADEEFIEKLLSMGTRNNPVLICVSPHYEYYLKDKEKFLEHLERIAKMNLKYEYGDLEFNVLLDQEKTKEYKELVEWVYHVARGKYKVCFVSSYVRRTRDAKEVVKNYAITSIFDKETRDYIREDFGGARLEYLRHNNHCGEICPVFENYVFIRMDGRLEATGCEQPIISNKSIYDDDFDLEEEKRQLTQVCKCKRQPNNGMCDHVHGLPPD